MTSLPKWITPTLKQTWVVIPVFMYKISAGMTLGFTTCLQSAIQDPESGIQMDMNTFSWFVSCIGIFLMIGFAVSSIFSQLGRRRSFLICTCPGIIGLFITAFVGDAKALTISRMFIGISIGSTSVIGAIVVGEYTSPENRGMFFNTATASLGLGSLLVHVMGHFISWRALAITIHVPFIIALLVAYTWPESPSWLAERKKYEKSRQAFYWLRGRTVETTREIEELIRAQGHKKIDKTALENITNFFLKFKMKNFWKPMIITTLTNLLMETSGRHIFPSYAVQLIKPMIPNDLDPFYFNIIFDLVITFGGFVSVYLIKVMRLRMLLFSSGFVTCILLCLASLTLYLITNGTLSSDCSWIPLFLFAAFSVVTNFGCTCIPLVVYGELFPLEHRVVASTLTWYIAAFFMTIVLKIVPYMLAAFKIYGTLAIIAICTAVTLFALYFILPETKNRTLQEIEDYFNNGKFRDGEAVPITDKDDDTPTH